MRRRVRGAPSKGHRQTVWEPPVQSVQFPGVDGYLNLIFYMKKRRFRKKGHEISKQYVNAYNWGYQQRPSAIRINGSKHFIIIGDTLPPESESGPIQDRTDKDKKRIIQSNERRSRITPPPAPQQQPRHEKTWQQNLWVKGVASIIGVTGLIAIVSWLELRNPR